LGARGQGGANKAAAEQADEFPPLHHVLVREPFGRLVRAKLA
jgi:hypothetical protein